MLKELEFILNQADAHASSSFNFLKLLCFSINSKDSWQLFSQFKYLGVLHLLVLSGSQVGALAKASSRMHSVLWDGLLLKAAWKPYGAQVFVCSILFFYNAVVGFDAPIFRASLFFFVHYLFPNLNKEARLIFIFSIHLWWEGIETMSLSFILTWTCYLLMISFGALKFFKKNVVLFWGLLSVICQLSAHYFLDLDLLAAPDAKTHFVYYLLVLISMNLVLAYLMENYLFPAAGYFVLLSLIAVVLKVICPNVYTLLEPLMSGGLSLFTYLADLFLVLIRGLNYIFYA